MPLTGLVLAGDTPDQTSVPPLSPFGIGADAHTVRDLTTWMPQMASIGIQMMRSPTTFSPDATLAEMDYLDKLNVKYGSLLIDIPPGDTADAPGTLPVKDLSSWSSYVTNKVKQANGRVKYWEVWNEPPNGIGHDQTAADYAKLMIGSYDAAHAIDPTCLVGLTTKSVHVNWLEQSIQAGAKDHFDYISLHPYEVLGIATTFPGAEAIYMNIVPTVRKMLAAQNPAKANVPIIFTELGFDAGRGADLQGYNLVKAYTMGIAQGVACIDWFEGIDGDSGPMGLLEANGAPRPAYQAMAQMIKHLGPHPTYLGWVLFDEKAYGFVFQGVKGPVLVAWPQKGMSADVDFGQPATIIDPLTGDALQQNSYHILTPVIVEGVAATLISQAQENKTKPFPWNGDFSQAKSVSVTFGETNVEKGLHTQSANTIANDVVTYGGSARAGSVPGGINVFLIFWCLYIPLNLYKK